MKAILCERHRDLMDLMLMTGCRPGELLSLTTGMIDRSEEIWRADLEKHKTQHHGKSRTLFFNLTAQLILRKYLHADPNVRLFKLRGDTFSNAIKAACIKAEVQVFTPHWLRHTTATRLADEVGVEGAHLHDRTLRRPPVAARSHGGTANEALRPRSSRQVKLAFRAPVNLIAQPGKPRRFNILAYTGGPLNVDGFDLPVIVDLQGLTAAGSVSIVLDYTTQTDTTVGSTDKIVNDGQSLILAGPVTGGHRPRVAAMIDQHDMGQKWQASIGANVTEQERIAEGRTVNVNGRQFSGPVIVAWQAELRHTGILPSGADSSTTVNLAAAAAARKNSAIAEKESKIMDFETWCREEMGQDPSQVSDKVRAMQQEQYDAAQAPDGGAPVATAQAGALVNLRATRAAHHRHIAEIESVAAGHPLIAAAAIERGWSKDKTELEIMKASQNPGRLTPSNFRAHNGDAPDETQVLCASFAMTAGASPKFLAKHMGEKVVDAATRLENRGASLYAVMAHVIHAAGDSVPSPRINDQFIRAAFRASQKLEASGLSVVGLPGILSNSANKLLLEGYEMPKTTWQNFCAIGNLNDLKEATRYRMTAKGQFEELPPGEQHRLPEFDSFSLGLPFLGLSQKRQISESSIR